jgi:chromosome segregation ATPase
MELILKCLKNLPRYRPSIGDVFDEVSHTASRIPPTFTDRVEGLTTIKSVAAEVEEKQRMMGERDMCIQDLITVVQEQEEHCQAEIQRVIEEKEEHSQAEIRQAIEQEVHKHVEAKAEIRRLTSQNLHCQAELQAAKERECAKDAELKRLRRNTQQLQADLLALLDASLQEARQQIAVSHQI